MLQQTEDICLRLDRVFRDGQDADVVVVDGDQGVPAAPGVLQGKVADQSLVKLRTAAWRQSGKVKFIYFALEDFRGLFRLLHAAAIFISSEKLIFAYRASIEALSKGNLSR